MANKVKGFQVDFSITNLSLLEQEKIYQHLISGLDFTQKEKLHITVTDPNGGKHHVWDGTGITPDGVCCNKCHEIDCVKCVTYKHMIEELKEKEI